MTRVNFKGFGGAAVEADVAGGEDDPAILILEKPGERAPWDRVSGALIEAGRRAIRVAFSLDGEAVANVQALLAQLGSRPVVLSQGDAAWLAAQALTGDAAHLAAGVVLVDMTGAVPERPSATAKELSLPTLCVKGAFAEVRPNAAREAFERALPSGESVEVEAFDLPFASDRTEVFLGLLLDFLERKQPRSGSEFRGGSDPRTLRDAMGCFATGITFSRNVVILSQ